MKIEKQSLSSLAAFGLAVAAVSPLAAAEVCVKCSGPDASYACIVDEEGSSNADSALNLYCISALAQSGPHASCAIDRNSVAPCQGARKVLPTPTGFGLEHNGGDTEADTATEPPAADATAGAAAQAQKKEPAAQPPPPAGSADDKKPEDKAEAPPRTVQEMVEKSAQSAGKSVSDANKSASDSMKKAGSAVNDAAKSTWKCLSSFFSDC